MYNEYEYLSFEEQLQLSEEEIRRRHNQRMFLRRNAEFLQQELELESQILEENPELSEMIHNLNALEIQAGQQGFRGMVQGDSTQKTQNVWGKFFPGLSGK